MNFNLTSPCDDCPFRRKGFISLRQGRVIDIVTAIAPPDGQGMSFSCHKTVHDITDDEAEGQHVPGPKEEYCAGALIFMEKQERPTQIVRIAERLGLYDRRKLRNQGEVFDSIEEMLQAHADAMGDRRAKASAKRWQADVRHVRRTRDQPRAKLRARRRGR